MAASMHATTEFSLAVEGVAGRCPAGERWAEQQIAKSRVPVLSCEGPCIRGDIARLAANRVAAQKPFGRACHAETLFVPQSGMARWVKSAETVVVIDGCFLKCHGRALKSIVEKEKIVHFDAMTLHKRYTDVFLMDDVPEAERKEVAGEVAEKITSALTELGTAAAGSTRDVASGSMHGTAITSWSVPA